MYGLLIVLFVLVAIFMTITILMQDAKGGGLAASFGGTGGSSLFGPRGAASFLQKATTVLATVYLLICLVLGFMGRPTSENPTSVIRQEMQKEQSQSGQQPSSLPMAPTPSPNQQPSGQQQQPQQQPDGQ